MHYLKLKYVQFINKAKFSKQVVKRSSTRSKKDSLSIEDNFDNCTPDTHESENDINKAFDDQYLVN